MRNGVAGGPISADVKGKVLLVQRGDCLFIEKLQIAFEAGAVAVVIYNTADTHKLYMGSPEGYMSPDVPQVRGGVLACLVVSRHAAGPCTLVYRLAVACLPEKQGTSRLVPKRLQTN